MLSSPYACDTRIELVPSSASPSAATPRSNRSHSSAGPLRPESGRSSGGAWIASRAPGTGRALSPSRSAARNALSCSSAALASCASRSPNALVRCGELVGAQRRAPPLRSLLGPLDHRDLRSTHDSPDVVVVRHWVGPRRGPLPVSIRLRSERRTRHDLPARVPSSSPFTIHWRIVSGDSFSSRGDLCDRQVLVLLEISHGQAPPTPRLPKFAKFHNLAKSPCGKVPPHGRARAQGCGERKRRLRSLGGPARIR